MEGLVKKVCDFKQNYTQYGGVRPFGTGLLVAGVDDFGCQLYETDPSGALVAYKAGSIGSGRPTVMDIFEKEFEDNMTYDAALTLGLRALAAATEDELNRTIRQLTSRIKKISEAQRGLIKARVLYSDDGQTRLPLEGDGAF
ncbi:hypothetical protein SDC9_204975 [bioreactor metagenome]|uniref:Proteasome endopeptidase complex n=1 Tax=bioreactor metagenome TaxID=1076179 RepID=A0A645J113_9ZZZZ